MSHETIIRWTLFIAAREAGGGAPRPAAVPEGGSLRSRAGAPAGSPQASLALGGSPLSSRPDSASLPWSALPDCFSGGASFRAARPGTAPSVGQCGPTSRRAATRSHPGPHRVGWRLAIQRQRLRIEEPSLTGGQLSTL